MYLWVGAAEKAPSCPGEAPVVIFEGYADPEPGSLTCPTCLCGESSTQCIPPLDWTAVNSTCAEAPNAMEMFFDGPANWNGICSTQTKIAAGLECPNAEPCVQSM